MRYASLGQTPGSLIPKSSQDKMLKNPGRVQNYDLAESFMFRETTMVKDLVSYFLSQPTTEKAEEYWKYFQGQWRQNIINYIKHTNGVESVFDNEIEHYKNNYKYKTAIRLVEEYVKRLVEMNRIQERFPKAASDNSKSMWTMNRIVNDIHLRLIAYSKELKASTEDPDFVTIRR